MTWDVSETHKPGKNAASNVFHERTIKLWANHPASIPANSNGAYPDETPSGNLNPHDINHEGPSEGYTGTGAPNPSEADSIAATGPAADAINRGGSVGSDEKDGMTGTRGNAHTSTSKK